MFLEMIKIKPFPQMAEGLSPNDIFIFFDLLVFLEALSI